MVRSTMAEGRNGVNATCIDERGPERGLKLDPVQVRYQAKRVHGGGLWARGSSTPMWRIGALRQVGH